MRCRARIIITLTTCVCDVKLKKKTFDLLSHLHTLPAQAYRIILILVKTSQHSACIHLHHQKYQALALFYMSEAYACTEWCWMLRQSTINASRSIIKRLLVTNSKCNMRFEWVSGTISKKKKKNLKLKLTSAFYVA